MKNKTWFLILIILLISITIALGIQGYTPTDIDKATNWTISKDTLTIRNGVYIDTNSENDSADYSNADYTGGSINICDYNAFKVDTSITGSGNYQVWLYTTGYAGNIRFNDFNTGGTDYVYFGDNASESSWNCSDMAYIRWRATGTNSENYTNLSFTNFEFIKLNITLNATKLYTSEEASGTYYLYDTTTDLLETNTIDTGTIYPSTWTKIGEKNISNWDVNTIEHKVTWPGQGYVNTEITYEDNTKENLTYQNNGAVIDYYYNKTPTYDKPITKITLYGLADGIISMEADITHLWGYDKGTNGQTQPFTPGTYIAEFTNSSYLGTKKKTLTLTADNTTINFPNLYDNNLTLTVKRTGFNDLVTKGDCNLTFTDGTYVYNITNLTISNPTNIAWLQKETTIYCNGTIDTFGTTNQQTETKNYTQTTNTDTIRLQSNAIALQFTSQTSGIIIYSNNSFHNFSETTLLIQTGSIPTGETGIYFNPVNNSEIMNNYTQRYEFWSTNETAYEDSIKLIGEGEYPQYFVVQDQFGEPIKGAEIRIYSGNISNILTQSEVELIQQHRTPDDGKILTYLEGYQFYLIQVNHENYTGINYTLPIFSFEWVFGQDTPKVLTLERTTSNNTIWNKIFMPKEVAKLTTTINGTIFKGDYNTMYFNTSYNSNTTNTDSFFLEWERIKLINGTHYNEQDSDVILYVYGNNELLFTRTITFYQATNGLFQPSDIDQTLLRSIYPILLIVILIGFQLLFRETETEGEQPFIWIGILSVLIHPIFVWLTITLAIYVASKMLKKTITSDI